MELRERYRGCLLGLACGDAVGTTVEFRPRGSFPPVTDMVGAGVFGLKPGQWTDDTSMALCLATSLVECGGFDARDQMERYVRWVREGYLSSNGRCFDVGNTVSDALERFLREGTPFAGDTDPHTAGNGCIMRLAPVPLFYYPDRDSALVWSVESSRTTHGTAECLDACRLLAGILYRALSGSDKETALFGHGVEGLRTENVRAIARGDYRTLTEAQVKGSGYVVRSLEAALWCVLHADTFEAAVLRAANLGEDADTTAAVAGQVVGALYGEAGIPPHWLGRLAMRAEITALADRLMRGSGLTDPPAR